MDCLYCELPILGTDTPEQRERASDRCLCNLALPTLQGLIDGNKIAVANYREFLRRWFLQGETRLDEATTQQVIQQATQPLPEAVVIRARALLRLSRLDAFHQVLDDYNAEIYDLMLRRAGGTDWHRKTLETIERMNGRSYAIQTLTAWQPSPMDCIA